MGTIIFALIVIWAFKDGYHILLLCTSAINLHENSWNGGITAIGNKNKQSRGIAPHVTAYFFLLSAIGIAATN